MTRKKLLQSLLRPRLRHPQSEIGMIKRISVFMALLFLLATTGAPFIEYAEARGHSRSSAPARSAPSRSHSVRSPSHKAPSHNKSNVKRSNKSTKKPTVKKPTTKKPAVKKPTTKKPTVKKPTTKKPTVKKPTVKKTNKKPSNLGKKPPKGPNGRNWGRHHHHRWGWDRWGKWLGYMALLGGAYYVYNELTSEWTEVPADDIGTVECEDCDTTEWVDEEVDA